MLLKPEYHWDKYSPTFLYERGEYTYAWKYFRTLCRGHTQYTVHYIMCNVHIKGSRFSQIRNRLIAAVAFGFLRLISMGIVLYFKSFLKNYICT